MIIFLFLASTTLKLASPGLAAGEGVSEKTVAAVSDAVNAEVRRHAGVTLVSQDEIKSALSLEEQKMMAGCSSTQCVAEVGGALGVDNMLTGSIGKVGESWLVFLKVIDVKKVTTLRQADRRIRKGGLDDVLDAIPGLVTELFGSSLATKAAPIATGTAPPPQAAVAPVGVPSAKAPAPAKNEPFGNVPAKTETFTDGKGHFFVFAPADNATGALFYGDGKSYYEQRIIGSSRNGEDFGMTFWDPRIMAGAKRSFDRRQGVYTLTCKDQTIALKKVPRPEGPFFKAHWRRRLVALAMDEAANYYLIDESRDDPGNFNLYVGKKGRLDYIPVDDAPRSDNSRSFVTDRGILVITDDPRGASFGEHKLNLLDVETQAGFVYTKLGVYNEPLMTACDSAF